MTGSGSADDSADNLKLVSFSLHFWILQVIKKWRCRRNEAMCFITEFMAECISIHDPSTQEVNPQALCLEDCLYVSDWG